MLTHPPDLPSGHPGHEGVGLDVSIDDRAGGDERMMTDRHAAHDRAVGAQSGTTFHPGVSIFVLSGNSRAWVIHVGKHHARTAKNTILQSNVVVNRDIILNLTIITNRHSIPNKHVLP